MDDREIHETLGMLKATIPQIKGKLEDTHDAVIRIQAQCEPCKQDVAALKHWQQEHVADMADMAQQTIMSLRTENSKLRNGRLRLYVICGALATAGGVGVPELLKLLGL